MKDHHMQRAEKKIEDRELLLEIIREQKYMTLAMCTKGQPYLVTMNYAFDENENCFFFHCAPQGKKIEYLKKNPNVWGQVLDETEYLEGECDYAYQSLHFKGTVEFLTALSEKKNALRMMIQQLEPHPKAVTTRLIDPSSLENVTIGKINVQFMIGKANTG